MIWDKSNSKQVQVKEEEFKLYNYGWHGEDEEEDLEDEELEEWLESHIDLFCSQLATYSPYRYQLTEF